MIQPDPDGPLFFIEIHGIAWPHEGWKTRSCHASAFNKLFGLTMEWSYDYSPDRNFSIQIPRYLWKRVWYCPGMAIWQPYPYPSVPLSILSWCYLHPCHAIFEMKLGTCRHVSSESKSMMATLWVQDLLQRPSSSSSACSVFNNVHATKFCSHTILAAHTMKQ